jgi:hypothetical protein
MAAANLPLTNAESQGGGYPEPVVQANITENNNHVIFPALCIPIVGDAVSRPWLFSFVGVCMAGFNSSLTAIFSAGPLRASPYAAAAQNQPYVWTDDLEDENNNDAAIEARMVCARLSIRQFVMFLKATGKMGDSGHFLGNAGESIQVFAFSEAAPEEGGTSFSFVSTLLNVRNITEVRASWTKIIAANATRQSFADIEGYWKDNEQDGDHHYNAIAIQFPNIYLPAYPLSRSVSTAIRDLFFTDSGNTEWIVIADNRQHERIINNYLTRGGSGIESVYSGLPGGSLANFTYNLEHIARTRFGIPPRNLWRAHANSPVLRPTGMIRQEEWARRHSNSQRVRSIAANATRAERQDFINEIRGWISEISAPAFNTRGRTFWGAEGGSTAAPDSGLTYQAMHFPREMVARAVLLPFEAWLEHPRAFDDWQSMMAFVNRHEEVTGQHQQHVNNSVLRKWPFWNYILIYNPESLGPYPNSLAELASQLAQRIRLHPSHAFKNSTTCSSLVDIKNAWAEGHQDPPYSVRGFFTLLRTACTLIK